MTKQRWCTLLLAAAITAGCTDRSPQPAAPDPAQPAAPVMAGGQYGQLQYFGYIIGNDEQMLNGTDSYANFGWFNTDADPYNPSVSYTLDRLGRHGMTTVIEMGKLLWCPPYTRLCPNWKARLATWRQVNQAALYSGNVLAFSVRDEPFWNRVDIIQMDSAARELKALFPSAKILLTEASAELEKNDPNSYFNRTKSFLTTVDWIAVNKYHIHPATDAGFQTSLARMKAAWPGRRTAYAADGWWASNGAHANAFGTTDRSVMAGIIREWYNVAAADPDAILVGVVSWNNFPEGTGSRELPRAVTLEQMAIGRAITGRTRASLYAPVGRIESVTAGGLASGWACDPDGAWAEAVQVDFYVGGVFAGSGLADRPSEAALMDPCRSGLFHRFQVQLSRTSGPVTAVVRDLSAGSTTISFSSVAVSWVHPAYATFGTPNTLTVGGQAAYGSGTVEMWWRDVSMGGSFQRAAATPAPAADGSWSNAIPTSNYCHDYQVYAVYSGVTSSTYTYRGLLTGYCEEQAQVTWIQPASTAGYGPPGSLVVAGSASGAPAGTGVVMRWRDLTLGGGWVQESYAPEPDGNGIWLNSIAGADPTHQYEVSVLYDVKESAPCTYAGASDITWC
jgi:hypothetical protein